MRTKALLLAGVVAVGAVTIWGYQAYAMRHPGTDDAYIGADVVRIAPRITGRLIDVRVSNQQRVTRGELLYTIDPTTFRFDLEQAQARLDSARREVAQADATVRSAAAEVQHRQVLLANARRNSERSRELFKKGFVARQSADDTGAAYQSAATDLQVAEAQLEEARRQLGTPGEGNDRIVGAKAAVDQARWALTNTRGSAPCDGQVAMLSLRPGSVVRADNDLFVVVCDTHYWVEANFKETQLLHIRPGEAADISVDMYPGHHFQGRVESVGAAAGAAFSLLPPQNASGNWVKVAQRVPVRVRIDDDDPAFPLRVGTSATVVIDSSTVPAKHLAATRVPHG